jgi:hypothetical protein
MSSKDTSKPEAAKSDGQDQHGKKNAFKKPYNGTRTSKFEGRCDELKGHIYDYGESKNADQFITTTKEVSNYVRRTFKNGGDMTEAIAAMAIPTRNEPDDPDDPDNRIELKKWELEYTEYRKWEKLTSDNVKTLFNKVWGQCTESMQQKVESLGTYTQMKADSDGIALLIAIQNTSYDYQSQKYRIESLNDALCRLLALRQGAHNSAHQYYEQFTNLLSVYNHCGGYTEPSPGALAFVAERDGWDVDNITAAQKATVMEMSWANLFIIHADRVRYGSLIAGLQNEYLTNNNNYQTTLNEAFSRLTHWKDPHANGRNNNNTSNGVSFTNVGNGGGGTKNT